MSVVFALRRLRSAFRVPASSSSPVSSGGWSWSPAGSSGRWSSCPAASAGSRRSVCGGESALSPPSGFALQAPGAALAAAPATAAGPVSATVEGTLEAVRDVVVQQLGVDRAKVLADSNFIKDLEADSLDSVELVMALEEKFGVNIPDEDATKITTVQEAVNYIQNNKVAPAAGG
eukprot:GHVT01073647.1.p1 GENE.GHVT01073647.1~~GHVT01073647.1.p1  ORF type:complete len:175 (+),score=52.73 GHVT01073647.1:600-1124(+)